MTVTSKQIAELCQVSRGTVDRALNNRPGVNAETRAKILRAAEQLGYRPHFLASSLAKGKTMTLGVIVFDLYNRIFSQLINAVELKAKENGYFVYLTLTDKDPMTEKKCIDHLVDRRVDGIIMLSVNKGNEFDTYLKDKDIPIITFGNRISDNWPFVWINDQQAIRDAVYCLSGRGYQEIVYISPTGASDTLNTYAIRQRIEAFEESVSRLNIKNPVITNLTNFTLRFDEIMSRSSYKKAILCSSDVIALEILDFLKRKGVSVPDDIGLMGFDNIDTLKYISPSLATVGYPVEKMGEEMVTCLIDIINGKTCTHDVLFDHTIITGKSI